MWNDERRCVGRYENDVQRCAVRNVVDALFPEGESAQAEAEGERLANLEGDELPAMRKLLLDVCFAGLRRAGRTRSGVALLLGCLKVRCPPTLRAPSSSIDAPKRAVEMEHAFFRSIMRRSSQLSLSRIGFVPAASCTCRAHALSTHTTHGMHSHSITRIRVVRLL